MNSNDTPRPSTTNNVHHSLASQMLVDDQQELARVDEIQAIVLAIAPKSVQETNGALSLTDMSVSNGSGHDCERCACSAASSRPTKRRKSSKTSLAESSLDAEESTPKNPCQEDDQYDEGVNLRTAPMAVPDALSQSLASTVAPLYNLGIANLREGQEGTALRLFQLALEMHQKDTDDGNRPALVTQEDAQDVHQESQVGEVVDELTMLHNVGCLHYRRREYDLALDAFTRLEVLALVKHGSHHLSVASALNCIGVVLFHSMDDPSDGTAANSSSSSSDSAVKNVLANLLESLRIRQSILGPDHKDVATSLNNVGRVYFDVGDYRRALTYYNESLATRRQILGCNHADVSATAFNAAQTCHKLGMLDEALPLYQEYYFIATSNKGGHHQGTIAALKHLGQVYHEQNQVNQALAHYNDALAVCRSVYGTQHRESASILNLLGNLHYENGNYDAAILSYEAGLSIERSVLHRHSDNIVVTLSNIGQALMQKGAYRAALDRYNEVHFLQCTRTEGTRDLKKISETLSIVGQINTLLGRYVQAERAFLRVVSAAGGGARATAVAGPEMALALNYLGLVYFKRGALDAAMDRFQESLKVRSALGGDITRSSSSEEGTAADQRGDVAVLLYNIASIYLHKGDNDAALDHYGRALEVERSALGPDHPDVAVTLKLMGKVYDRCGRFEEAVKCFEEALEIYVRCYESGDTEEDGVSVRGHKRNAAKLLALVARVHLRGGNAAGATSALTRAYRLYSEIGERPPRELEMGTGTSGGFDLYELSMLHPECAGAA